MELKDIKKFIERFIKNEYEFSRADYNAEIPDSECEKLAEDLNVFFYYQKYNSVSSIVKNKAKNSKYEQGYKLHFDKIIPRTLFQTKQYKNPRLGDSLKRIVTGNDLFACYVSYPSKGGRDLYFSSIFYVAETDKGWKIIYKRSFDSDSGTWYNPEDMAHVTVIEEGELIATERYKAPEETTSLADYNFDRPKILMFYLSEFDQTFGKTPMDISKTIYDSPFYIYDKSLKATGPKFPDEKDISDEDCKIGFAILRKIWTEHVGQSSSTFYSALFKKIANPDNKTFLVEPTYGFAPGYDLDSAIENVSQQNFVVIRWDEFWSSDQNLNKKYSKQLPEDVLQEVRALSKAGGNFQMGHKNLKAVDSFKSAYELLPNPKDQWNETSSLLRNIAENYYLKAFFDCKSAEESKKYYLLSLQYFYEYMKNPSEVGWAINHGKIGQIWYELGDFENAKEELMRAYMDEGKEWFADLDPKYYALIKPLIEQSS